MSCVAGRAQHDARLHALAVGIASTKVNWILDADIAGFFDTLSHDRLIRKWLKAGGDGRRGSGGHDGSASAMPRVIPKVLINDP